VWSALPHDVQGSEVTNGRQSPTEGRILWRVREAALTGRRLASKGSGTLYVSMRGHRYEQTYGAGYADLQLHRPERWRGRRGAFHPPRDSGQRDHGNGVTCWRLRHWRPDGVWRQLHHRLLDWLDGQVDWSRASIDSVSVSEWRGGSIASIRSTGQTMLEHRARYPDVYAPPLPGEIGV
jgi:hypothetical protein